MDKIKEKPKDNKTNFFSDWLEKLQQESWQLELLISGLALYGIFEAKSLILDIRLNSFQTEGTLRNMLNLLYVMLYIGRIIFLVNLLIHIMLRGLWIGAIGLRYVSGDIDYNTLNYSKRFTGYLKKKIGSYDDFIEKLEKICSIIFAYTFLLFLLLLSFITFVAIPVIIIGLLSSVFPFEDYRVYYEVILYLYYGIGFLVFVDFISTGLLKKIKNKKISKIYFFLYRFVSLVSLSFLYRPLLYNFLDEKFTKKLFFLSIPYIFLVAFGNKLFNNDLYPYVENSLKLQEKGLAVHYSNYQDLRDKVLQYKNKKEKKEFYSSIPVVVLSEYYMDDPFPSLFIKMTIADRNILKKNKALLPIFEEGVKFSFPDGQSPRVEIEDAMKHKIDSLYSINYRKKKRDSLHGNFNFSLESRHQDSLNTEEKNYINIMNSFMDLVDIKIDGISYNDSLFCKYSTHLSSGNKGFLCHFKSKSLSVGYHELTYERIYYSGKKGKESIYKVRLPFIKIK